MSSKRAPGGSDLDLARRAALCRACPDRTDSPYALLLEHEEKFFKEVRERLPRAAEISKRLRRERELALDGDIDFIPTEEYSAADAERAYAEAAWVVALATDAIDRLLPP